jgi:hypothetical protein
VIDAVRGRLVSATDVREAASSPALSGRRELLEVLALLEAGCESELEIWGHLGVFDLPGLRHGVRQKVVRVHGVRYRLDLAYEAEKVAVELDGRATITATGAASATTAATPHLRVSAG